MRKLLNYLAPIIVTLVLSIISLLPKNIKKYDELTDYLNSSIFELYGIVTAVAILIFAIHHLSTFRRSYSYYKKIETYRSKILDNISGIIVKEYRKLGVNLRINYMRPKRLFKYFFTKKILIMDYHYDMDHDGDLGLRFATNQGACGEAFTSKLVLADLTKIDIKSYNLTTEQLKRTSHLKTVLSIPVFEREIEKDKSTDKVIGVLNFDSRSDQIITNQAIITNLTERIEATSTLLSLIY